MPYLGANSSARRALEARTTGTAVADIVDSTLRGLEREAHGNADPVRIRKGYARHIGYQRAIRPVRYELERVGLKARRIAETIAKAVAKLDSDDTAEQAIGMQALKLLLKVRGDLTTQVVAVAQPGNVNVLIGVLRELGGRYPIPDVVVSETSATHNDSLACEVVDVTPEEPES